MRKATLGRLLAVSLTANITTNMAHPVTPTLMEMRGFPDYMFGVLFAAMAVGSLIFAPVWGNFSDRHGRVKAMAGSILGYAAAQLAFCFCANPVLVVCVRFVGGSFAIATTVLLLAYGVDISDERTRARNLSFLAASSTVGASLGYFAGGFVGMISTEATFLTQVALLVVTSAMMYFLLAESHPAETGAPRERKDKRAARDMLTPSLVLFLAGVALAIFGSTGYDNALNYYFRDQMRYDAWVNGLLRGVAGLTGLAVNVWINTWIARRFELHKALCTVLSACAALVCAMIVMPNLPLFFAMKFLFDIFAAMYPPIQQAAVAENQKRDFGLLSGLFGSARSVGMISGSLAAGFLYALKPAFAFYAQGIGFLLAAAATFASYRMIKRSRARAA